MSSEKTFTGISWQTVLSHLKSQLSKPNFQLLLNSTTCESTTETKITLIVRNNYTKTWLKDHCEQKIITFLEEMGQDNTLIDYHINENIPEKNQLELFKQPSKDIQEQTSPTTLYQSKFTFSNYIVGNHNRFAHAAALAVSSKPAEAYNPLFIYGPVGVGKTHLLQAIENQIKENFSDLKPTIITSEKFTNDLINALKNKKTRNFKDYYRNTDVFLIDDVQFLAGKEATQEEFFHTFNELHASNKQIVLTSDRPPKDIPTLQDRLKTRFSWGLIADIQAPELETRIAILRKKIDDQNTHISDEIIHYISTQIPSNIRELEGALNKITAYKTLLNREISLSDASSIIRDMVQSNQEAPLTISKIKKHCSKYFNIPLDELVGKKRTKELVLSRQIAIYLCRELTDLSLPKIGENFGGRDHSTIMHACDKIKLELNHNSEIKQSVNNLIDILKST